MQYLKTEENQITHVGVNPNLPDISNYPVPNPTTGGSGGILAIIMGMTIFGVVVNKLLA